MVISQFNLLLICTFYMYKYIGILSLLEVVRASNDLGHPLCHNLRGGDWLINYTINRLRLLPATAKVLLVF